MERAAEAERLYLEALNDCEAGRDDLALPKMKRAMRLGGFSCAAFGLACLYDDAGDTVRALRLYRRLARGGLDSAANNIARHYEMSDRKALYFRWIRRTAELGDEDAVEELDNPAAYMFDRGLREYCNGSAEKGAAIILRAAEWGNKDALERLRTISLAHFTRLKWRKG